ncbi:TonB-dependent receptor domain-containing protein [Sphingobacterium spiritivorum]|uniref:TonB-dependent receptor n=1 Tax=Sphingobacterium spiritivorum ATCC 33861 TaxID=525373 RepID=D7VTA6_SPHSI|nr:TonB-dependent receptor [Sphingobacterium spiritivorum]EFK57007.1 TonB-dependent receptor [Sphingobacterium spiritivorum ATCC 33861]QQT34986.1 TonB-dependent receptor [Sphingobacterium spiritivorum]WQD35881.1 TonB-dependent receptor [Sphingobacterium spiritivorum]SUJ02954.1 Colicin I receptor precursor [Sphingobacterium spiritivorum]
MKKLFAILIPLLFCAGLVHATKIKGKVFDKLSGEALVGATVVLEKSGKSASTGLDGSFEIKGLSAGKENIQISYLNYESVVEEITVLKEDTPPFAFYLLSKSTQLMEVSIKSKGPGSGDGEARRIEQNASQVMNIISGKAIELSPDLTVANVMQRVSGVSLERNSNGDGQYAILRGMDKRYNYTLVNGVKLPSPDNKYRYIPLDIFPSDLLERLEVYKSLTPNMEADAIGGAVNMIMKNAPERLQINANVSTGYSQLFFDNKFTSYNSSSIQSKSPYELNGRDYKASQTDFSKGTLDYSSKQPAPNILSSLSVGQRFFNNKLGVIVAGSYQNTYRGSTSTLYNNAVTGTDAYAVITNKVERQYSEQQKRLGLHSKVDYVLDQNNKFSFYNMYVNLLNEQVREAVTTNYNGEYKPDLGNAELVYQTRSRKTNQKIYNGTLQGTHNLLDDKFSIRWAAVYSSALNDVPQNTQITLNGLEQNFERRRTTLVNTAPVNYRWERNTDDDMAAYWDLKYKLEMKDAKLELSTGGLYRDKQRSSFYNNYTLAPSESDIGKQYGVDYQNYTELNLRVTNPTGAVSNPLTYDATEKTTAVYAMFNYQAERLQAIGGARMEHNNQGYNLLFPAGENSPAGRQVYTDILPSLTVKYLFDSKSQLHASYAKSLNRPGFYELVPSKVVNEEYQERGNPNLMRALADNFDLRYELFPGASEQLLAGVFYKKIKNPIEYTFQADATRGQDIYYSPGNFGNANNYGAEVDYIKYVNKFGVKANYTYTHSRITTPKTQRRINPTSGDIEAISVEQTRPLYGQSEHIANLALLFKDTKTGWDAQVAAAYTGPRINTVSQFLNNDLWQKGFIQMDFSAEKRFKHGLTVFAKANNILDTPMKLFIKGTNPENDKIAENLVSGGQTLIRSDYYGQSYLVGVRYKLN